MLENDQKSQLQKKHGGLKDPMLDDVKGFSTMDEVSYYVNLFLKRKYTHEYDIYDLKYSKSEPKY